MTERKPANVGFETWADQQVREAMERGEFDNLPGAGKPIENLVVPYDEVWLARKFRAEGFSTEEMLPTPLKLRKEIERLPATLRELTTEAHVREHAADLDSRIRQWLRAPTGDHHVWLHPLDIDAIVTRWHQERPAGPSSEPEPAYDRDPSTDRATRPPWWRRLFARRRWR